MPQFRPIIGTVLALGHAGDALTPNDLDLRPRHGPSRFIEGTRRKTCVLRIPDSIIPLGPESVSVWQTITRWLPDFRLGLAMAQ
ncbi:MAG: hypothetical protein H7Z74_08485 [Anaerolineae bacterium]|nr:hypothetical protein [Gemmatimonadaceae bacterium]